MRIHLLSISVVLLLAGGHRAAHAHGGQFRGPGGSVDPKLRQPHDPETPPPPPPPPSGGPVTPPTGPGGTPGPGTPPDKPLPTTTRPPEANLPGGSGGRRASLTYESWMFWYEHNREPIEQLKTAIYSRISSPSPLGVLGGGREAAGSEGGTTQGTASAVRASVAPTLLWALTHGGHPDVEGAAAIALAKVAWLPEHIDAIRALLSTRPGEAREELAREGAALALGLLRREQAQRRFTAAELDRARTTLFAVLEDERAFSTRTRAFAAAGLGLLGDQPTGSGATPEPDAAARATTQRLLDLFARPHADARLPVTIALGLGLMPRRSFGEEGLEMLRQAALRGRVAGREVDELVRAHAALALGRIDDVAHVRPLLTLLGARSTDLSTRRSAAIGLGRLGRLLPPAERAQLAKDLRATLEGASDASTRSFGLMSLAALAVAELPERRSETLLGAGVGATLIAEATDGRHAQRPFAALALGLVLRAMEDLPPTDAHAQFDAQARAALRAGLAGRSLDPRDRAAYAVGLGMARDLPSRAALLELAGDPRAEVTLRGYSAVAVGLVGRAGPEVVKRLRALLAERSSEELTQQAARALGLAQDEGAVDVLVAALERSESTHARAQIGAALARIGDARALAPLERLLRDTRLGAELRAISAAGLGVVGDLEPLPSLTRLTRDLNYRATNDVVSELAAIL